MPRGGELRRTRAKAPEEMLIQRSFYISRQTDRDLNEAALRASTTKNAVIRRAVEEHLRGKVCHCPSPDQHSSPPG
jgi:hypothetical protein